MDPELPMIEVCSPKSVSIVVCRVVALPSSKLVIFWLEPFANLDSPYIGHKTQAWSY